MPPAGIKPAIPASQRLRTRGHWDWLMALLVCLNVGSWENELKRKCEVNQSPDSIKILINET
jgi:hypothetical protein